MTRPGQRFERGKCERCLREVALNASTGSPRSHKCPHGSTCVAPAWGGDIDPEDCPECEHARRLLKPCPAGAGGVLIVPTCVMDAVLTAGPEHDVLELKWAGKEPPALTVVVEGAGRPSVRSNAENGVLLLQLNVQLAQPELGGAA